MLLSRTLRILSNPEEQQEEIMSKEGKAVFKRFCLIALGIPSVLLAFVVALYLSPWAIEQAEVTEGVLTVATVCLAVAGVAIWAFFSFYLYRRLWKVFPYIGDREKGWSYAEGVFGLLGVGTSMSSLLANFYYLFSGDIKRSAVLFGLSYLLAAVEAFRFPMRIADVEDTIMEME
jgi:ABC-type proline/glycine betaine transport system permease subunit